MKIIKTISEIREALTMERLSGKTIGFVPTMGYFHEGHLALIREARRMCDVVVISIFINPIQFGPSEDYNSYPRDFKRDSRLAKREGVDYIFSPSVEEMYPSPYLTYVNVEKITKKLCGAQRPGHFKGVATVVTKLFNVIEPDQAFFGEKDAQQFLVIKKMASDLSLAIEIFGVPTVREKDGLAMSSRNIYLNSEERKAATVLFHSLSLARTLIDAGERDVVRIKEKMLNIIRSEPLVDLEYLSICDVGTLEEVFLISGKVLIVLAARVGKARLIDNIFISQEN